MVVIYIQSEPTMICNLTHLLRVDIERGKRTKSELSDNLKAWLIMDSDIHLFETRAQHMIHKNDDDLTKELFLLSMMSIPRRARERRS